MNVVRILPRVPHDEPIIIIKQAGTAFIPKRDFIVRRHVVRAWLIWLKANNIAPIFANLEISEENLSVLPEYGEINDLRTIETEEVVDVPPNLENAQELAPNGEQTDQLSQGLARSCSLDENLPSE